MTTRRTAQGERKALDAFIAAKAEIDAMLERLKAPQRRPFRDHPTRSIGATSGPEPLRGPAAPDHRQRLQGRRTRHLTRPSGTTASRATGGGLWPHTEGAHAALPQNHAGGPDDHPSEHPVQSCPAPRRSPAISPFRCPRGWSAPPPKMVVGKMIARGWLEGGREASLRRGEPIWRETGDDHGTTLIATEAGLGPSGSSRSRQRYRQRAEGDARSRHTGSDARRHRQHQNPSPSAPAPNPAHIIALPARPGCVRSPNSRPPSVGAYRRGSISGVD